MIREGLKKEKRAEQLIIIQANEEKISLKLNNKVNLFKNDLFNNLPKLTKDSNVKSNEIIKNIQNDNLEFKETNFEGIMDKIVETK